MCPPLTATVTAPPLGVMPRWLWDEINPQPTADEVWVRANDVADAIRRRINTPHPIPEEWGDEILDRFRQRRELAGGDAT